MAERTVTVNRLECPACRADVTPPVGTKIPSLPQAIFWKCEQCQKALVIYLDLSGETPALGVKGITINQPPKEVARG